MLHFVADLNDFAEMLDNDINLYSGGGPLRGTEDRSMMYNMDAEMFFVTTDYDKSKNIMREKELSVHHTGAQSDHRRLCGGRLGAKGLHLSASP